LEVVSEHPLRSHLPTTRITINDCLTLMASI
jgi:hypothetical protein